MPFRFIAVLLIVSTCTVTSAAQPSYWVQAGGPYGGTEVSALIQTADGSLLAGTNGGVYISADNGTSWQPYNEGLPGREVRAFLRRPDGTILVALFGEGVFFRSSGDGSWSRSGLLGVSTTSLAENNTGTLFAGTISGLLRSFDNGLNWYVVDYFNSVAGGVLSIVANDSYVFVGTVAGVYRSPDEGLNWEFVGLPNTADPRIEALAVNEQGDVFTGTSPGTSDGSVYRSRNNGDLWFRLQLSSDPYHVKALSFDDDGLLYAGGYRKIYFSDTGGDSWRQAVITNTSVQALSFSGDRVFAGTTGRGVLRSYRGGTTWEEANHGIPSSINDVSVTPGGTVYVATAGGVYQSFDRGLSWVLLVDGLSTLDARTLALDHDGRLFVGTLNGVFRLDNNLWTSVSPPGNPSIRDLAVGPDGEIYAGFFRGVYRLNNPGIWQQIPIVGPDEGYRDIIAITTENNGTVYAGSHFDALRSTDNVSVWTQMDMFGSGAQVLAFGRDSTLYAGTKWVGVLCSFDRGERWNMLINGMTGLEDIRSFGFDENGIIHAGTYGSGVYSFHPWYQRWMPVNAGLDDYRVVALDFDDHGNGYAGTVGGGLFFHAAPSHTFSENEKLLPTSLVLHGSYPNPFNPVTTIQFSLPEPATVLFEVFDILGKRLLSLPEQNYPAAPDHIVQLDGSALPSGTYLFRLTARSATTIWQETCHAILVK